MFAREARGENAMGKPEEEQDSEASRGRREATRNHWQLTQWLSFNGAQLKL